MHKSVEIFSHSPQFDALFASNAALVRVDAHTAWAEGPVWINEAQCLLWSDIPNNRMMRWSAVDGVSEWRGTVEYTNGHTRDLDGHLLHCSHGQRAVVRTRFTEAGFLPSAQNEIIVDRFEGKRLNSPNDIVVRRDGTIWFTDPPYGILSDREGYAAPQEQTACSVFCFDPSSGQLTSASTHCIHPNGLAFSPDERTLYVSDTSAVIFGKSGFHHIVAFDVNGCFLSNPKVFATVSPGLPDGFRVDCDGNVWTSSGDSVQVFAPDGALLGKISVPEKVGNLTFGGTHGSTLFIVASTSLYMIETCTKDATSK